MLSMQVARRPDSREDWIAGRSSATNTPMMAMTTSISTRVKAVELLRVEMGSGLILHLASLIGESFVENETRPHFRGHQFTHWLASTTLPSLRLPNLLKTS